MMAYLKTRIKAGEGFPEIAESFHIERPWLQNWLENRATTIQGTEKLSVESIGVEEFSVLLEEWVSDRRELSDSEALCSAAIQGDVAILSQLLEADASWDAEDRFGITAGEYALYFRRTDALELLMTHGAQQVVAQMQNSSEQDQSGSESHKKPDMEACLPLGGNEETTRKSWGYLDGSVQYREGSLVDEQGMPVMMPWEGSLMKAHALQMKDAHHVINIGFGCGYVDSFIQALVTPQAHTIIEAHPDVIKHLELSEWPAKKGVRIRRGRWQDVMPRLLLEPSSTAANKDQETPEVDCIFYDTHDEGVAEFLAIARAAAQLLRHSPSSTAHKSFSFWNGMEFHNAYRHSVYCRALQHFLTLPEGGAYSHVSFQRLKVDLVPEDWQVWESKGLRYWHLNSYYLPICHVNNAEDCAPALMTPCYEDLSDWMLQGIHKGALYHGFNDQSVEIQSVLKPSDPTKQPKRQKKSSSGSIS